MQAPTTISAISPDSHDTQATLDQGGDPLWLAHRAEAEETTWGQFCKSMHAIAYRLTLADRPSNTESEISLYAVSTVATCIHCIV